jgi:hypothetical protein
MRFRVDSRSVRFSRSARSSPDDVRRHHSCPVVASRARVSRRGHISWTVAAAAVLLLAVGPSASAQTQTFGAIMSNPADSTVTCDDGFPDGGLPAESCMWDSGYLAPNSGIVTSVQIEVGPTTGAMEFVVLRSYFQNSSTPGEPNIYCCGIQAYSAPFTPTANGITTVPTSLPMVEQPVPPEGDTTDYAIGDVLALEVLEPGVPIPAYIVPNAPIGTFPDFGFAPAPSAYGITAPSSQLYHYNWDWNGYVVMMNATLDSEITSAPTPTPIHPALPVVQFPTKGSLAVRRNKVTVPLDCTGAACKGTLLLQSASTAKIANAAKSSKPHVARLTTYGSATFNASAGTTVSVTTSLNAAGRKLMRAHRRVTVFLNVKFTAGGGTPESTSLVLKR